MTARGTVPGELHPLTRACDAPFDPPRTFGDVTDLYTRRMLRQIRGLGPRKISEIEAALEDGEPSLAWPRRHACRGAALIGMLQ